MLPPQLTRYPSGSQRIDAKEDFTLFVLDYFFVATPAVARSFGAIARTNPLWWREAPTQWPPAGLAQLGRRIRRRFHGKPFPPWAHLYWAEHVTNTLVPAGVSLRFLLLHEADFTLARFWRHGRDCLTSVRRWAGDAGAARVGVGDGGASVGAATGVVAGADGGGHGGGHGGGRDGDDAWASFVNNTAVARALRGAGHHHLASSALAEQCPAELERGSHVFCPWFSQACAHEAAATLSAAEDAGRFQASAKLAPRQLLSAERCVTPACLSYRGTARKTVGKQGRVRKSSQASM